MQLWRPQSELDGINAGSWCHCLPIGIYYWLGEGGCIAAVCEVVCCTEVRPGPSGKKMRWHFSEQRWECSDGCVKVKDRVPSKELRERLGLDDIILILQQKRLRWYGHVLRKEDTDWVKTCMKYEVEGSRPSGRPKRTWKEVVQKDCQARNLNKDDAMDRGRRKKLIKVGWWSGWWVGECFFWYRLS